jgi:hypothetical protein
VEETCDEHGSASAWRIVVGCMDVEGNWTVYENQAFFQPDKARCTISRLLVFRLSLILHLTSTESGVGGESQYLEFSS